MYMHEARSAENVIDNSLRKTNGLRNGDERRVEREKEVRFDAASVAAQHVWRGHREHCAGVQPQLIS